MKNIYADLSALLDTDRIPSLRNNSKCEGCGETKTHRGAEAPTLVCCQQCFRKLPKWMRSAFKNDLRLPTGIAPGGTTVWEHRVAVMLRWMREANTSGE